MASVSRKRTIQFTDRNGQRRTVGLGRFNFTQRQFDGVLLRIENLVAAQLSSNALDPDTARWLGEIGDPLAQKLANVGLIAPRASAALGGFLDCYVSSRADVKESTRTVLGHTRRCLIEFFGADKLIRDITEGDADDWRLWLIGNEKLADNTVRRRCAIAKQFFRSAHRKGLVSANPFSHLAGTVRQNTKRLFYVTRAMADRVLKACPDAEWRLIFALSRYGGLRCPSEHLALKWSDIDWEHGRMTVRSPKTEHYVGGESRQIPIFPELRSYLEAASARAEEHGTEFVIARYRDASCNLRTRLIKIIKKAGLQPWPKLFQNLRSTRETELTEHWPLHIVVAWLGNSQLIAAKHYLQVRDEDFDRAASGTSEEENAAQALQQASANGCNEAKTADNANRKPAFCSPLQPIAAPCRADSYDDMGHKGLEPLTSRV
jgi:integrase